MEAMAKKSAEAVETLREKAARLQEEATRMAQEAARVAQEAAMAAEEHALAVDEHALAHGEHLPALAAEHLPAKAAKQAAAMALAGPMYFNEKARLELDGEELDSDEQMLAAVVAALMGTTAHINLTPLQRRSLLGSGVRRLGFILKVADTAEDRPEFIPPFFALEDIRRVAHFIRVLRNMRTLAQTIDRMVADALLVAGHDAFQMALMYYNTVKEAARRGVKGAAELLATLDLFFRRGRRGDEEPTIEEVEKDIRALLKGKKDGKVIIEHLAGLMEKGKTVLVDEAHKPGEGGAWKATAEGEIN